MNKRKVIFKYLKDKDLDVIFLQETHSNKSVNKLWKTEWGGQWVTSSGSSKSKGCAIMFRPKAKIEITKVATDHEGRYCICNIRVENIEYTLCNVYGPNQDQPDFYKNCFKILNKMANENLIIGGDFNLVLDTEKDRYKSKTNNDKAAAYLKHFMEENEINDVWRD